VGAQLTLHSDLAAFAAATVEEGCVGETLSAAIAAEALRVCTDPAVRNSLAMIVRDERRHAALAWRTVAWALRVGDETVREAVRRAFDKALARPVVVAPEAAFPAFGRLGSKRGAAVAEAALRAVVGPTSKALLALSPESLQTAA
jgi:hypothetical protein